MISDKKPRTRQVPERKYIARHICSRRVGAIVVLKKEHSVYVFMCVCVCVCIIRTSSAVARDKSTIVSRCTLYGDIVSYC